MAKKLLTFFMKKNCNKPTKKNLELKNSLKGKETNYMSNGKDITTHLLPALTKRIL